MTFLRLLAAGIDNSVNMEKFSIYAFEWSCNKKAIWRKVPLIGAMHCSLQFRTEESDFWIKGLT